MRKSRFTKTQILGTLNEVEAGKSVKDACVWRVKYKGMEVSQVMRLKELEEENNRLKHMYAELRIDHRILKDIVEKKL